MVEFPALKYPTNPPVPNKSELFMPLLYSFGTWIVPPEQEISWSVAREPLKFPS